LSNRSAGVRWAWPLRCCSLTSTYLLLCEGVYLDESLTRDTTSCPPTTAPQPLTLTKTPRSSTLSPNPEPKHSTRNLAQNLNPKF
jgi:hypothetical protein